MALARPGAPASRPLAALLLLLLLLLAPALTLLGGESGAQALGDGGRGRVCLPGWIPWALGLSRWVPGLTAGLSAGPGMGAEGCTAAGHLGQRGVCPGPRGLL